MAKYAVKESEKVAVKRLVFYPISIMIIYMFGFINAIDQFVSGDHVTYNNMLFYLKHF